MTTHVIRARVDRRFSGEYLVYDVVKKYQAWDDPSYGNGGGYYVGAEKVVASLDSEDKAVKMRDALNKWDGTE